MDNPMCPNCNARTFRITEDGTPDTPEQVLALLHLKQTAEGNYELQFSPTMMVVSYVCTQCGKVELYTARDRGVVHPEYFQIIHLDAGTTPAE